MKKFGIVLLCLIVGGIFCIGSIKLLDGVPEFCLAVLSVEIFCLIMMKLYKPEKTKGEIFIEEAKAAGRVVTAHLVKKSISTKIAIVKVPQEDVVLTMWESINM